MYILKNALRNVMRSKGRSILIGIMVVLISLSACIGLCIRHASDTAEKAALDNLVITAQITPDREQAMEKGRGGSPDSENPPQEFDREAMQDAMKESLSLEELQKYAEADSVKNFYYTLSLSMDAGDGISAFETSENQSGPEFPERNTSDFMITGYSSDDAMTGFTDGTCTIKDGKVFSEGTEKLVCIISDEFAEYNNLKTGDSIKLADPSDEDRAVTLKIAGIYTNSQSSAMFGEPGMGRNTVDPANNIYMSYAAVKKIADQNNLSGSLSGTYVVEDMYSYESFCKEVEEIGLEEGYAVSSSDLNEYERSLAPLQNLSGYAHYFIILIVVIGIAVLGILNIFSTRERKYEIGVLTAIGMKKSKVAAMFVSEILIIALAGTILGGSIGAAVSVPAAEHLLSSQLVSSQNEMDRRDQAFGRESSDNMKEQQESMPEIPDNDAGNPSYMTAVSSSVDITVLLKVLLCSIAIAALSGLASVFTIMRCDPLDILSERD